MDRMVLRRMVFYGYHGVFPEENRLGQKFIVDLDLRLELAEAGRTDDVNDTVNYAEIHALVKKIVEGEPVKLIEALAERIASAVLGTYTIIQEAAVSVTKPNPPFDITFDGVTVELRRCRDSGGKAVPVKDSRILKEAYVALGANLGNRDGSLREALRRLAETPGVELRRISDVYETDPVGYADQPAFLNMAAAVGTALGPVDLLRRLLEIEKDMGRVRDIRWGPRTIDLDLLWYEEVRMDTEELTLPHPRMGERAFVLVPLRDIWPADAAFPWEWSGGPVSLAEQEGIRLWGRLDESLPRQEEGGK